ncbi:MAG: hypothetical protein WDN31_14660 [Hyphomicrobium sp.]
MSASATEVAHSLVKSFETSTEVASPYRHWLLKDCLPQSTVDEILGLPISAPDLGGVSGKRELHNNSRHYFDVPNREKFASAESVAAALQDQGVTSAIERIFDIKLDGTYLRIEFAQDIDGFLAGAAHRHRRQGLHVPALSVDGSLPRGPRHRHLRQRQEVGRPLAVRLQRGDDLRALQHHLPRLLKRASSTVCASRWSSTMSPTTGVRASSSPIPSSRCAAANRSAPDAGGPGDLDRTTSGAPSGARSAFGGSRRLLYEGCRAAALACAPVAERLR